MVPLDLIESPSCAKIQQLSEKWKNIENELAKEKVERKEQIDDKIKQLDDKVTKIRPLEEAKFK